MNSTTTQLPDGIRVSLRRVAYAPLDEHTRHCHDHCSITLILSGALEEGAHSGMQRFGAFSVVTKPAGVYHQDRYGPQGTRTFQLAFTTEHAREFCPGMSYTWERGGPTARAMLDLFLRDRAGYTPTERDNGIIEVLTCASESAPPSYRARNTGQLGSIREFLDAEACHLISIRQLADEARMHPVSLARAFRRQFGCSITDYVRRRRVASSCELMDTEGLPLAHVAAAAGFADQPHFTRAFKTETGLTPAAYRRLATDSGISSNRSRQHKSSVVF